MISESTPEQWERIRELRNRTLGSQAEAVSHESVVEVGERMYKSLGLAAPIVLQAPSPLAIPIWVAVVNSIAKLDNQLDNQLLNQLRNQLYNQLDNQLRNQLLNQLRNQLYNQLTEAERPYVGVFWRVWSAWYRGAEILGVTFDTEKLCLLDKWSRCVPCFHATEGVLFTCRNPTECHWEGEDLHNDSGPSVVWEDGFSLWTIRGVQVNEQIVMSPETQSLEDIRGEENAEVKRIRIERFGWQRYLQDVGANTVDERRNDVDGTNEGLVAAGDMRALVGRCRSTGRVYFLEVPGETQTCEQAQLYLRGDKQGNPIGAS